MARTKHTSIHAGRGRGHLQQRRTQPKPHPLFDSASDDDDSILSITPPPAASRKKQQISESKQADSDSDLSVDLSDGNPSLEGANSSDDDDSEDERKPAAKPTKDIHQLFSNHNLGEEKVELYALRTWFKDNNNDNTRRKFDLMPCQFTFDREQYLQFVY